MDFEKYYNLSKRVAFSIQYGTLYTFQSNILPIFIDVAKRKLDVYMSSPNYCIHSAQCFDQYWMKFEDTKDFYFCYS